MNLTSDRKFLEMYVLDNDIQLHIDVENLRQSKSISGKHFWSKKKLLRLSLYIFISFLYLQTKDLEMFQQEPSRPTVIILAITRMHKTLKKAIWKRKGSVICTYVICGLKDCNWQKHTFTFIH